MLRYVVALPAEARPLIGRYGLRPDPGSEAFRVYRHGDVALVVSGLGKVAAAAATAYLHLAAGNRPDAVWLNVGIAGGGRRAVGEAILAHQITDQASGVSWRPAQLPAVDCATAEVVTVDRVERHYPGDAVYEMEASGFYPTACRFVPSGLVHCVKVVSDGPGVDPESLTARRVEELVAARLGLLERIAQLLWPKT